MKTPREVILNQHREAEARLKAMQPEIIAACARESGNPTKAERHSSTGSRSVFTRFWMESVLPWRRAWIGMAALWVGILSLHFSAGEREVTGVASAPETDPQARMVLLEQKRLLAQLLEPMSEPRIRRVTTTGPRSEARLEEVIV
jgi:hypothetical protein